MASKQGVAQLNWQTTSFVWSGAGESWERTAKARRTNIKDFMKKRELMFEKMVSNGRDFNYKFRFHSLNKALSARWWWFNANNFGTKQILTQIFGVITNSNLTSKHFAPIRMLRFCNYLNSGYFFRNRWLCKNRFLILKVFLIIKFWFQIRFWIINFWFVFFYFFAKIRPVKVIVRDKNY